MKKFFSRFNQSIQAFKNLNFTQESLNTPTISEPKFPLKKGFGDEQILEQRKENLKSIFEGIKKYEVKLDPWSVGDIYQYHMLREVVEASYKTAPKITESGQAILHENADNGEVQLTGENFAHSNGELANG